MVRTRIAPSPTGFAHIGTIYQVLFDYAFAKKHQGQFIVRIEDTDRARFVEGAEQVIYDCLAWFNLEPDESPVKGGPYVPYRSSERLTTYQKYAKVLIDESHAYYCFCSKERLEQMRQEQQKKGLPAKYDKHCLSLSKQDIAKNLESGKEHVIRLNVPSGEKISFKDEIAGEIEFESNLIDDQVLIKSDGYPTYHLAVVVDDYLMKISHVFRGTEWISSTPKHILIYKYLGWERQIPVFVHLPLILNPDGQGKLSKRQQSASVDFYKQEGFLPEAILNYLSNIVWNHPEGKEVYSLEEFIKLFKISDLQNKGARFDLSKLEWMNGEYIRGLSDEELTKRLQEFLVDLSDGALAKSDYPAKDKILKVVPLIKERIKKLSDFVPLTNFIFQKPEYDLAEFKKIKIENVKEVLEKIRESLDTMKKPWNAETFEKTFRDMVEKLKIPAREMFQLIRLAVSGQLVTPPLFDSIELIGEDEVLNRVKELATIYPKISDSSEDLSLKEKD